MSDAIEARDAAAPDDGPPGVAPETGGAVGRLIGFFLHNRALAAALAAALLLGGWLTAPFPWPHRPAGLEPIGVDVLPNLGDNQQVVYTEWPGQSPRDVEDQITYPSPRPCWA